MIRAIVSRWGLSPAVVGSSDRRRERGASLILVSGALVAFAAVAALAVDYGQLVSQRRALITATDAASLAAANELAGGATITSACADAQTYLATNAPGHNPTSFTCDATTRPGYVEVGASQTVAYGFASVVGLTQGTAFSSTASEYATAPSIGLRPFLLCRTYTPELAAWIDGTGPLPSPVTFSMGDNLDDCVVDGGSGNWAIADFDGGSNPLGDIRNWIANGYSGTVDSCQDVSCPPVPTTCPTDVTACTFGDPGVPANSISSELNSIIGNGTISLLPVVREVTTDNGNNLQARIERFVHAELLDYRVTGNSSGRWLEFRFIDATDPLVTAGGGVRICGATLTDCP